MIKNLPSPLKRPLPSLGFTLIEVVIALAILAFAFFGMISVIAYSSRMNQATKERLFAMRAAEAKIEQMLACVNFDDIFAQFGPQAAFGGNPRVGRGWDEVRETALDGSEYYALQAVSPPIVFKPLVTGYVPPSPPDSGLKLTAPAPKVGTTSPPAVGGPAPQITVFVHFPLDAAGNLTEVKSGEFAGNRKMDTTPGPTQDQPMNDPGTGAPLYVDLDLNGKDGNAQTSAGSAGPPVVPPLLATELKLLPVIIEVIWRGTVGPARGNTGNTYLQYRYTFFRKT